MRATEVASLALDEWLATVDVLSDRDFSMCAYEGVMETGTVKWFNNAKGWGFIAATDGSDVFVHYSQIAGDGYRTLREGQRVQYDLRSGPRGQFAENVRVGQGEEPTAIAV